MTVASTTAPVDHRPADLAGGVGAGGQNAFEFQRVAVAQFGAVIEFSLSPACTRYCRPPSSMIANIDNNLSFHPGVAGQSARRKVLESRPAGRRRTDAGGQLCRPQGTTRPLEPTAGGRIGPPGWRETGKYNRATAPISRAPACGNFCSSPVASKHRIIRCSGLMSARETI